MRKEICKRPVSGRCKESIVGSYIIYKSHQDYFGQSTVINLVGKKTTCIAAHLTSHDSGVKLSLKNTISFIDKLTLLSACSVSSVRGSWENLQLSPE